MEELQAQTPIVVKEKMTQQTWTQWFGTDEAINWVYLIFGFFVTVLLMTILQFSTQAICCGDWDGYYHIKWSQLLWENFKQGKWLPEFVWLPLTVLNAQDYADHHFLFIFCRFRFYGFLNPCWRQKSRRFFTAAWRFFRFIG